MTDEQLPTAPLPAVRADSVRQENQPQPELPVEAEEEKTASLADPGEAGEEKTASLTNPGEAREEANSLLPAHLAELTAEETLLLPAFQPGINVGREAHGPSSQPGIGVERAPYAPISQAGVHVGLPASWSGIIIEEMPWPQAAPPGRTPMPASLAGISAEETPLPLGYTQEIEREKTVLLPVPQWRKRLSRKNISLLACVAGLVIVVLIGVSVLALYGRQRSMSPSTGRIVSSTPASTATSPSASTPTPQAQPVQPFPATLQAEISTLEAHDRFFYNGNTNLPEIALTFDDGPSPAYTPQVLAILKKYHVHATFFDIGRLVQTYPQLARQELREGHDVGNHTWSHPDLPLLTQKEVKEQIQQTSDEIERAIGVRPTFIRPPYGDISSRVLTVINKFAMTTIIWNDEARDWSLPGTAVIVARILNLARAGAIVLLHDGGGVRAQTIQALPTIIEKLRARGYSFVTMDELVAHIHKHKASETPTPTPTPSVTSTPLPESIINPHTGDIPEKRMR